MRVRVRGEYEGEGEGEGEGEVLDLVAELHPDPTAGEECGLCMGACMST